MSILKRGWILDNDSELYDLDRGLTPLHCASKRGHSSAILILAAAGADKEAQVFLSLFYVLVAFVDNSPSCQS